MTWTPQAEPTDVWRTNRPTRTRRITEDGRLRITENGALASAPGVIRIIERDNANAWHNDILPSDVWSVSDA